jgi:xanthine/uracil permease
MDNNVSYRKGCKVAAVFLRINCVVYAISAVMIAIMGLASGMLALIPTAIGSAAFSFLYGWMASSVKAMVKDIEADTPENEGE